MEFPLIMRILLPKLVLHIKKVDDDLLSVALENMKNIYPEAMGVKEYLTHSGFQTLDLKPYKTKGCF